MNFNEGGIPQLSLGYFKDQRSEEPMRTKEVAKIYQARLSHPKRWEESKVEKGRKLHECKAVISVVPSWVGET